MAAARRPFSFTGQDRALPERCEARGTPGSARERVFEPIVVGPQFRATDLRYGRAPTRRHLPNTLHEAALGTRGRDWRGGGAAGGRRVDPVQPLGARGCG